jgi:hypothetical protein
VSSFPETENQQPASLDAPTGPDPNAWKVAAIVIGVSLLLGLLLAVYVLAWDGGAHT